MSERMVSSGLEPWGWRDVRGEHWMTLGPAQSPQFVRHLVIIIL